MAYEQKDGDIAIFKVKDKTNEKGPDWTGRAMIDGEEKQVSLWIKSDTMLAGQIKEKFKPNHDAKKQVEQSSPQDDFEDQIPF